MWLFEGPLFFNGFISRHCSLPGSATLAASNWESVEDDGRVHGRPESEEQHHLYQDTPEGGRRGLCLIATTLENFCEKS